MNLVIKKAIETACGKLVLSSPFISSILLSTDLEINEDLPFSLATNGSKILINPGRFEMLLKDTGVSPVEAMKTGFAHETYHIALQHIFRRGNRDAMAVDANGQEISCWNIACDYVINAMLERDGFTPIPGWAITKEITAMEMAAEEVYDWLVKKLKDNPKRQVRSVAFDDCMDGDSGAPEGESPSDKEGRELKIRMKVQQALEASKAMGKLPGSMERYVTEAMAPKVEWREELRNTVTSTFKKEDYSWSKLNRRHIWNNMYLPGMTGSEVGSIFLEFDTSGSVGQKEFACFLGEMNGIFEECSPSEVMVQCCDSDVQGDHITLEEEDFPMEPKQFSRMCKGGGGTAFAPVFNYLKDKHIKPDMLIYFTDLYGSDFGEDPGYPVVWVSTGSTDAPFGKVIKIEV